jgi:uncharacterized membrane protein YcfT
LSSLRDRIEWTDAPAPKPRVDWVDHAKGICIFFVVMLHVNDLVQAQLGVHGWLEHVVVFARPFRMPDFFLIAGLFLASSMRRPWRHYLDTKVVHFLYFYVLWMTLNFVAFDLRHAGDRGAAIISDYFLRFLDPSGPLWFIHILPIFFVLTRVTRRVPWWLMWLGAATLHALPIETGWHVPDELASRYVFFYSGYIFAPHLFRIAAWARAHLGYALGYLCVWGLVNGLVVGAGFADTPAASLPLGYAGALAVIVAAVVLSTRSWTKPLRYLGENSIVLYLGDALVSVAVTRMLLPPEGDAGTLGLVATLLTIVGTVVLWRVLLRTPAAFLYRRPAWSHLVPQTRAGSSPAGSAPQAGRGDRRTAGRSDC